MCCRSILKHTGVQLKLINVSQNVKVMYISTGPSQIVC
jgi:hypothetical protein